MKVRLTKRKGCTSITIRAAKHGQEGIDLRDAVLAAGSIKVNEPVAMGDTEAVDAAGRIFDVLGERGYRGEFTQRSKNVTEAVISKREAV